MNELQVFNFNESQIRTLLINNEPYFIGKDVANILGYERADNAIRNHVDNKDKLMHQIDASGQKRNMILINESGLYSLILSSKLPTAKKFKRWVTSEVLPAIRKTGRYQVPSDPMSALRLMFEAQTQTNEAVAKHDLRITELEENKLLNPGEYNYIGKAIRNKVNQVKNELGMDLVQKQTSKIYHAINRDLNCFIGIKTRSQFKAKDFNKALEFIENWQLSYTDKRMIEQMSFDL